jgi:hypothetical protein
MLEIDLVKKSNFGKDEYQKKIYSHCRVLSDGAGQQNQLYQKNQEEEKKKKQKGWECRLGSWGNARVCVRTG